MPLIPPPNMQTREAVLAFGVFGSGKSIGWSTIAEMYRLTSTPGEGTCASLDIPDIAAPERVTA